MKVKPVHKWILIGVFEILLSLFLISIAPVFLNSDQPIWGLFIWLFVIILLGASGIYVVFRLTDAEKARRLFVRKFPEYSQLGVTDFLEISSTQVTRQLNLLESLKNDTNFTALNISLFDVLKEER